jgi:uroporphyrinogen decarboxylase
MIEGGGSKNYVNTKSLMYSDAGAWHAIMSLIARALTRYLNAQIEAGAQALQIFDSWVGCLSPDDYKEFVLPHTKQVIGGIQPGVPVIHFGTGTSSLLELMSEAGGHVVGLDWRIRLDEGWKRIGSRQGVMGNPGSGCAVLVDGCSSLSGRTYSRASKRATRTHFQSRSRHTSRNAR